MSLDDQENRQSLPPNQAGHHPHHHAHHHAHHHERDDEDERDYGVDAELVEEVQELLEEGDAAHVRELTEELHAADIADLIEQTAPDQRSALINALRPGFDGEVLSYLNVDVREQIIEQFGMKELAAAVAELDTDDAVDVIEDLDEEQRREVLQALPADTRALVEENLTYEEYSAGRMMQREFVAVPPFWTVGRVIDHLRDAGPDDLPENFYDLFVVDPMHRVVGTVPLSRLLRAKRDGGIADLATEEFHTIPAVKDQEEVANLFRQYALVSAPVVDAADRLIGVITVDDVVHIIDEEAEDDFLKLGGVADTSIYRSVLATSKARVPWLAVNLGTAFMAAGVISLFEASIEKIVALAVLSPIVASMGGNAGTQALTVAVRALATRELSPSNAARVVGKEALVGLVNGLVFATLVGLIAGLWFAPAIGVVIGLAMITNLFVAGLAGTAIPVVLDRLGVDPADSSAVFLTTVTDVIGFFSFLGLATLFLL